MEKHARRPGQTPGRRARLTRQTYDDVKAVALTQLAESGPSGVSMRAIARELEMTASAVHYYYPTRAALIEALTIDGFHALAVTLRRTYVDGDGMTPDERWIAVTRAFRAWALEQPARYQLIYGQIGGRAARMRPEVAQGLGRVVAVLYDMMRDCHLAGLVDVERLESEMPASTRSEVVDWREASPEISDIPDGALAACMLCYSRLHGAISLELAGHIPPMLVDRDALFDLQMSHTAEALRPRRRPPGGNS